MNQVQEQGEKTEQEEKKKADRPAINISHFGNLPDDAGVSVRAIAALTGNGVSTIWRYHANDPTFPKSIKLSARCTRFRVGDVRAWLAGKEAA